MPASLPVVRAVARAVEILAALSEGQLRLVDLSQRLELHKATVARLLETLTALDMVVRDGSGRYSLGPRIALIAGSLLTRYRRVAELLRDPAHRVWEATQETVAIHVRAGLERLCVAELESPYTIGFRAGVATRVPLHLGATGKVLLAFLPEDEQNAILAKLRLRPATRRSVTNPDRLRAQLAEIREQGYAITSGEHIPGGTAISVPVFDASRRLVAAVSIHGPDARLPFAKATKCAALLRREIRPLAVVIPQDWESYQTPGNDGRR